MKKLVEKLEQMTLVQALLLGIAFAAIYFFTAFDNGDRLNTQMKAMAESIKLKKEQVEKLKTADAEKDKIASQLNTIAEQFKSLLQYIPTELNQADLMRSIIDEARLAGTKNIRIQPQKDTRKQDFYEALMIELNFEGTFVQGMTFLAAVTKLPRIINVDHFDVQVKGKDKLEPESFAQVPGLAFHAVLAGYRYVPEVSDKADKGAKRGK